jgi:hypothetical protein
MGDTGLEHHALTPTKTQILQNGGAKSGALKDEIDSNLAWLTEHWPGLPEHVRKQIIETARTALSGGPMP